MICDADDFRLVVGDEEKQRAIFSVDTERIDAAPMRLHKLGIQRRVTNVCLKKS